MKKPLSFRSVKAMKCWLRDTDAGREIVADIRHEIAEDMRGTEQCLVLLYSDAWVEVHAGRSVDVCMAIVPVDASDRVLEAILPNSFRDVFAPVPRKASQCVRVSLGDLVDRATALELVGECMARPVPLNGRTLGVVV